MASKPSKSRSAFMLSAATGIKTPSPSTCVCSSRRSRAAFNSSAQSGPTVPSGPTSGNSSSMLIVVVLMLALSLKDPKRDVARGIRTQDDLIFRIQVYRRRGVNAHVGITLNDHVVFALAPEAMIYDRVVYRDGNIFDHVRFHRRALIKILKRFINVILYAI